jgi:hypothetical protein
MGEVSEVSEYRVSDPGILKSLGVSVSDTGVEVSEDRVSDTEKSIGFPSLQNTVPYCEQIFINTIFLHFNFSPNILAYVVLRRKTFSVCKVLSKPVVANKERLFLGFKFQTRL